MYRAEILVTSGSEQGVHDVEYFEGEHAIREGYQYFKNAIETRADWLERATVSRDFEGFMRAEIQLRIGPQPFWSETYLQKKKLGKYALIT